MKITALSCVLASGLSLANASLIGHWPLDELSGSVATDAVAGNDGVNNGGGLTWETGFLGGGARLDGANASGHHFEISSIAGMNGATALTISCWIKPDAAGGYRGIVMTRGVTDTNGSGRNWGLARRDVNRIDGRVSSAATGTLADTSPAGEWIHLALVWDGVAKQRTVFINGTAASGPITTNTPISITTNGAWFIGQDPFSNSRHFGGVIDDVAMWDEALTPTQVDSIYQGGISGLDAPSALVGDPPPLNQDYYVSPSGNDANPGTETMPFRTLAKASQFARPGDTVFLRAGTYREKVVPGRSGQPGNPITFSAYPGETPIITTADLVTGWTVDSGNVWKATVDWDAGTDGEGNTLFQDGILRFQASEGAEVDPLEFSNWGQIPRGNLASDSFTAPDLAGWGDDYWNGATVRTHRNDWTIETRTIADYRSSDGKVTFDTPLGVISQKHVTGYRIYGIKNALNQSGEWFKDSATDTLFYQVFPGQDPNNFQIEFKRRDYCFDVSGTDYIHISGITMRGGGIFTDEGTSYNQWDNNKIYAYDKGNYGRVWISGSNNIFRDNEVSQSWGSVATVTGSDHQIINNYLHDIGYVGTTRVFVMRGSRHFVSHNTVRKFARSFLDGYPERSEFCYNLFEDGANLSWDTGVFDGDSGRGNGGGCIVHHNVFRNSPSIGIYTAFYAGLDLVIHHNIVHDFTGPQTPTLRTSQLQFAKYYHNTLIGNAPRGDVNAGEVAYQSSYTNNLQITTDEVASLGVQTKGNHDYSATDFVNFSGKDFRLTAGSGAIDKGIILPGINDSFGGNAPDAGALEFGETMWDVGHNFASPPSPTYAWQAFPGTNLYDNGQFRTEATGWTETGTPVWFYANTWNTTSSGLSSYGGYAMQLEPGDGISRVFEGLKPDTDYIIATDARLLDQIIEAEVYDGVSGAVNAGTYRGEDYVEGFTEGEWLRYDNIDFGFYRHYNAMELSYSTPPGTPRAVRDASLEVRLDSPTGTLLGTFTFSQAASDSWYATGFTGISVTGSHSVYLVPKGPDANLMRYAALRLLNTNPRTDNQLTVGVRNHGGSEIVTAAGKPYWRFAYEEFSFRTGSSTTSAEVFIINNGAYDAYLDRLAIFEMPADEANVAPQGITLQSTTSAGCNAELAVNGNLADQICTNVEYGAWWQVDLGRSVALSSLRVIAPQNDGSKLRRVRMSLWQTDPRVGGHAVWENGYFMTAPDAGSTFVVKGTDLSSDGVTEFHDHQVRFVRIQRDAFDRMEIAEVQVFSFDETDLVASDGNVSSGSNFWQATFAQVVNVGEIELVNVNGNNFTDLGDFRVSVLDEENGTILWSRDYLVGSNVSRGGSFLITGDEIEDGSTTRLASVIGKAVRIEKIGAGSLAFEDVIVRSAAEAPPLSNLALNGAASQVSDFYADDGTADLAINSVISPRADFTSTLSQSNPWWQVELAENSAIDQIVVFNREEVPERIGNFRVSVWNADPDNGGSELWGQNYSYANGDLPAGEALTIDQNINGARYVRVQINGTNILSLPEVQVWAPPTELRLDPNAEVYNFDLGTPSSPVQWTWTRVSPSTHGDVFWTGQVDSIDRNPGGGINNINRDFVFSDGPATLNFRIRDGHWRVTTNMGDPDLARDKMLVRAEGQVIRSAHNAAAGEFTYVIFDLDVTDGVLNLQYDDAGGIDPDWVLSRVTLSRLGDAAPVTETVVDLDRTQFRYDFGSLTSLLAPGYERINPETFGGIEWLQPVVAVDRGGNDALLQDFVSASGPVTLEHAVSNGVWDVSLIAGDTLAHDQMIYTVEGITLGTLSNPAGAYPYLNGRVVVLDGKMTLTMDDLGGADPDWILNSLALTKVDDNIDSDGDSLPDLFEQMAYGHPTANATMTSDLDSDGTPDAAELVAGTDPADNTSQLKLHESRSSVVEDQVGMEVVTLEWSSVPGRIYHIQQCPSLTDGEWIIAASGIVATDTMTSHTITVDGEDYYFRVGVEAPQAP